MDNLYLDTFCRSPHGERGLKLVIPTGDANQTGRSPHGERGLKFLSPFRYYVHSLSLPPRGAWIEIRNYQKEIDLKQSLPPRGAWIEISMEKPLFSIIAVAPPTGSVD